MQDLTNTLIYLEQRSPRGAVVAAPEGRSQLLQRDVAIVACTRCQSCYVLHDFPFPDRLLDTAFVTTPLGGNKDKCVSKRKGR